MARESFRFIHASDFHLEVPFQDLPDIPATLRQVFLDAPWRAAESVFEHAVVENVDFVVLAGDLLSPTTCGARALAFLVEQFETLHERGIQVYWAGGEAEAAIRLPAGLPLPSNVHCFGNQGVEVKRFERDGQPIATILGRSRDAGQTVRAAEYRFEPEGTYAIAVGHGQADVESLATQSVDYWALGGRHQMEIVQAEEPTVAYCGSPQGRAVVEEGPHGFLLVDVDAQHRAQIRPVDVDLVRYSEQDIEVEDGTDLKAVASKRVSRLMAESNGRHLLVKWRLRVDVDALAGLSVNDLDQWIHWLRHEFGRGQPACWPIGFEVLPPAKFPASWQDEDTILGDFLRIAEKARKRNGGAVDLRPLVETETGGNKRWSSWLALNDQAQQAATLSRSTLMGVELLRGRKPDLLAGTRRYGGSDE
ncbi:MAG: DNA repair exonuclease [Pirellulaceae bacterium]|nr:MAG: DNA repair exonuclease [Pirellulaceae bacterium]